MKTEKAFHSYYPVFLNVSDKKCVVVGGGHVAERKIQRLLDCGASVEVVSPELTPRLMDYCRNGRIIRLHGRYESTILGDAFLVIAATDNKSVNQRVARDARRLGILANIADDPQRCDFIVPSLVKRGDLAIAVSTGGKSPALAKKIREELEERYGMEYSCLLEILGELRDRMVSEGRDPEKNSKSFDAVVHSGILDAIRAGQLQKIEALIQRLTGIEMEVKKQ